MASQSIPAPDFFVVFVSGDFFYTFFLGFSATCFEVVLSLLDVSCFAVSCMTYIRMF
jgi:hypothetical protein